MLRQKLNNYVKHNDISNHTVIYRNMTLQNAFENGNFVACRLPQVLFGFS